jgi:hypothetical protein
MAKTLAVVLVMLGAFLAGVPIALVAIAGAAYTLLTRRVNPDKVYREIDWKLLVLFSGLFVVMGGVEASGLAEELLGVAAAASLYRPAVLAVVTAVLSNLVSNVPAVLLFKSVNSDVRRAHPWMADPGHGVHTRRQPDDRGLRGEPDRRRGGARERHPDRILRLLPGRRADHGRHAVRWLAGADRASGVSLNDRLSVLTGSAMRDGDPRAPAQRKLSLDSGG